MISTIISIFIYNSEWGTTAPQPAADARTYFNCSAFAGVCGRLRASAGKPLVYPRRRRPQPPADAPSMYSALHTWLRLRASAGGIWYKYGAPDYWSNVRLVAALGVLPRIHTSAGKSGCGRLRASAGGAADSRKSSCGNNDSIQYCRSGSLRLDWSFMT